MSQRIVSFMIDEDLYKMVQKHCFEIDKNIKDFFADVVRKELKVEGDDNGTTTKTSKRLK